MNKIFKYRENKCLVIVFITFIVLSLFFQINVNAHTFYHQQDMHPAHHNSSACVSNPCCITITFNNSIFVFEPYIVFSYLFITPTSVALNKNVDLPYKPPKL